MVERQGLGGMTAARGRHGGRRPREVGTSPAVGPHGPPTVPTVASPHGALPPAPTRPVSPQLHVPPRLQHLELRAVLAAAEAGRIPAHSGSPTSISAAERLGLQFQQRAAGSGVRSSG